VLIVGSAYWLLHTDTPDLAEREAPLVPRLAPDYPGEPRTADAEELLGWAEQATPLARINTATDRLPNGLALSMLPFMVDWEHSDVDGDAPFLLMRNVNAGGNPVIGENLLATLRIPLDGLDALQWCLTPTRNKKRGKDTFMGHAMLRFLFTKDRTSGHSGPGRQPLRGALPPDDLMLSWEAWRPPMTSYDGLKGLDPETYTLGNTTWDRRPSWNWCRPGCRPGFRTWSPPTRPDCWHTSRVRCCSWSATGRSCPSRPIASWRRRGCCCRTRRRTQAARCSTPSIRPPGHPTARSRTT
jgi:hypothetical protein